MGIIIILIVLWIIGAILMVVKHVIAKIIISVNNKSNPEKAIKAVEDAYSDEVITLNGYEAQLLKIAKSSQSPKSMRKLIEFYTKEKKDEQQAKYWCYRAIQCGDIETILDFYGFSDYDVSCNNYNEMLTVLNGVNSDSDEQLFTINYCKGVVYYKIGQTETAKKMFEECKNIIVQSRILNADASFKNNCDYLIFLCYSEEGNMDEAQGILSILENNEFKVPAQSYLRIYDYYVGKRTKGKPAYAMEIAYVIQYEMCEDADREKLNQIGGDSYYCCAVACENGTDGYEKNKKAAMELYEMAAGFKHAEALYYVGVHSWTADNHDRDYVKANNYLLEACLKGHKKAKEFILQYGVDGVLVFPIRAETTTYTFMNRYQLTASADVIKWIHLLAGILYSKHRIGERFLKTYSNTIKSFDDLMAKIHQLYADHIVMMLQWCVGLLMRFDIDSYSANDILEICDDLSLTSRMPLFKKEVEKIDNRAQQLNLQTAYSKLLRPTWSGAGFGSTIGETVRAGIDASIAAGIMNIGSGILHGIGDSIVSSMNNSEIKDMEKNLFKKKNTQKEFYNAMSYACSEIGSSTLRIIEKERNIKINSLNGTILFRNENLERLDKRTLDAKIANNIMAKKYDYVYVLLVEKLRRNPLDEETWKAIFKNVLLLDKMLKNEDLDMLSRYAHDFMVDLSKVEDDINKITNIHR